MILKIKKKILFWQTQEPKLWEKYYNQILANYWTLIVRKKTLGLKYLQQQKNNSEKILENIYTK